MITVNILLLRVARAAKEYNKVLGSGSVTEGGWLFELREALKKLPVGLLDE